MVTHCNLNGRFTVKFNRSLFINNIRMLYEAFCITCFIIFYNFHNW